MGYGFDFPAYQIGGHKIVWDFGGYGLVRVWVKAVTTVLENVHYQRQWESTAF